MTTAILEQEQKQAIETEIVPALQKAKSLIVKSQEQRLEAVSFVKYLKALRENIEKKYHPTANKKKAYEVYEDLLETEHELYDPIDEAVKITSAAVKTFDTQDAIRIQREAQQAEAKRQEEERKETERLQALAKKAAEKGKIEKAETLREQAATVSIAPSFTPPPQQVKKLVWKARPTNVYALCKAVAEGFVPWSVLEINQAALNSFAKNYDGKSVIPGLEFYQEAVTRL